MNATEYRQHPALNFSLAKHLLDSPAHFKAAQDEEFEPSEAMMLGTILHAAVLEGKDIMSEYAIKPEGMSFATKEGKAWRDAQTKPILSDAKAQMIPLCAQSLADDPAIATALRLCPNRETPLVCEYGGIQIKALLDMSGDGIIADLKTTQDCSMRKFQSKIADLHYDLQAAWYCAAYAQVHGLSEPPAFYWVAVELKAPFARAIYRASDSVMESGMRKMEIVIERYKECIASGEWKLPKTEIQQIEMPEWANSN